jgi:hypothetical protein
MCLVEAATWLWKLASTLVLLKAFQSPVLNMPVNVIVTTNCAIMVLKLKMVVVCLARVTQARSAVVRID